MKILHITPSYKPAYVYAGVIESIARLCAGLAEAGHSVDVFTTTANGDKELPLPSGKEQDVEGVRVTYFRRITKDPTHASPALWKHLWRNCRNYDVVHIHSWWNILVVVSAWICVIRHVGIIVSPRGMLSEYILKTRHARVKKWIHRTVGKRVLLKSVLHATAQSEYDECTRLLNGWQGFLLPNILLLSESEVVREENPVFTMLFLSRVHPKKGIELLFRAMAGLPFDVRLRIAGTGDEVYAKALKEEAEVLGISGKVAWLGWKDRDEKFNELMRSDCMVLTSYNENFANVVIESLHVGTPVLISEQVGLSAFVRERNLGWVSGLTVQEIRETIVRAFEDKATRDYVNRNGRDIVSESFCQPVLIRQYVENYRQLSQSLQGVD